MHPSPEREISPPVAPANARGRLAVITISPNPGITGDAVNRIHDAVSHFAVIFDLGGLTSIVSSKRPHSEVKKINLKQARYLCSLAINNSPFTLFRNRYESFPELISSRKI